MVRGTAISLASSSSAPSSSSTSGAALAGTGGGSGDCSSVGGCAMTGSCATVLLRLALQHDVKSGLLRWHVDDKLNRPFATGLFDIIIRNAFQKGVGGSATVIKAFHIAYVLYLVPLSLYPQLPFSLPPNPTYVPLLPLVQGQSLQAFRSPPPHPLPFLPTPPVGSHSTPSAHLILALYPSSQPYLCASVAPFAVAVTPGLPLTSSSPSTLPPNPTYVTLGNHSRPSVYLILTLYPSSQPYLCASVAPCAGAVTPGLPLTSSSPSSLPPNPTYVPLLPLVQGQSLQAFRSPHPHPLPFLPTPPMCLCCPLCRGSHSRPSAHLILTLFPSSQPHLCASVAPCAGAVTPGLPLTSSSPSSLPPNPTYVPLLPLVQGQSLLPCRKTLQHTSPMPISHSPLCAPCCPRVATFAAHHTTNGKKVSTDACVNHDQILSLHRKVKAAIKKYLDDTPDDQLPSWDADHQGWVFGPTGTVVISGSGFPNHIPDGADPDKRDQEEAEILVKYCRMQADKVEAKRGCQAQGDGRDDDDNEVGNWMDEGDDEY
ncbi:unnamed protein product [Closterium sp. NIES-65]|nr:unnamed protein product [Closterium sp. NIES-65]